MDLRDLTKGNTVPKKVFTVKNTGQIVEIQYNWLWRNIVVRLGDRDIGHFKNMRPLKEGQLLKSPIGDIHVQYKQTMLTGSGFEVWHDNNALNGSLSDPVQYWRTGYKTALFLGLFNIVIGGITLLTKNSLLASIGAGPYSLVFGVWCCSWVCGRGGGAQALNLLLQPS